MRIIAGALKGRIFSAPTGHRTHPMSEKSRGAIFNALGDITGLTIVDPFAGSGAICFEAISRGASHATAIDSDRNAQHAISINITSLNLENKVSLIKANASAWLTTNNSKFDILILDPPFKNLQYSLLEKLVYVVQASGTIALSWPGKHEIPKLVNTEQLQIKNYGDNTLIFLRKI